MHNSKLFLIAGFGLLGTLGSGAEKGTDVIAIVGGQRVTRDDFEQKEATRLFQARNQYYLAQKDALNSLVDEQLLEQKARAENLTVEQLIQRDVASQVKDPTEDQMKVYYEGLGTEQPFDEVRGQILAHIRELRMTKARAEYMKTLKSQAHVVTHLMPPAAEVSLDDTPVWGPRNAPVTVVEFADYECPYCQQIYPEIKKLEKEFEGKISFAFKDCPLPMHSHAMKAAEAANCAGSQGKYWEYHDVLFGSGNKLEVGQLKENARHLGLDTARFDQCLDSGAEAKKVAKGLTEAKTLGITGTPSFFINGHFYSGTMKYEALREVVEQELSVANGGAELKASR